MKSPFSYLRSKTLMVILVFMAMVSFTLLDPTIVQSLGSLPTLMGMLFGGIVLGGILWIVGLQMGKGKEYALAGALIGVMIGYIGMRFTTSGTAPIVVQTSVRNFNEQDLVNLIRNRQIANQFVQMAFIRSSEDESFGMPPSLNFGFGRPMEEDVVFGFLLQKEAEGLGLAVSDETVSNYILQVTNNRLNREQFREIRNDMRISESDLYDVIRGELKARLAFQMLSPQALPTPEHYWKLYRKLNVTQELDVTAIPVEAFFDEVPDPTDSQVAGLFEQYKTVFPNQRGHAHPGFRQPRKLKVAYLEADYEAVEARIPAVTDEEIEAYYEANKEALYKNPPTPELGGELLDDEALKLDFPEDGPSLTPDDSPEATPEEPANDDPQPADSEPESPAADTETPTNSDADSDQPQDDSADSESANENSENGASGDEGSGNDENGADENGADESSAAIQQPRFSNTAFLVSFNEEESEGAAANEPAASEDETPEDANSEESAPSSDDAGTDDAGTDDDDKGSGDKNADADNPESHEQPAPVEAPKPAQPSEESDSDAEADVSDAPDMPAEDPDPIPEYRPLDADLREEIRDQLLIQRTMAAMQERIDLAIGEMLQLGDRFYSPTDEITAEEIADRLREFAQDNDLRYAETPLLSFQELLDSEEYPIGNATEPVGSDFERQQARQVLEMLADTQPDQQLYTPAKAQDPLTDSLFAYWKIDDVESHVPTLDDPGVVEQVVRAWKLQEARPLAEKRAQELAELARKQGHEQGLAEVLGEQTVTGREDDLQLTVRPTEPFSWMRRSQAPSANPFFGPPPELSTISAIDNAGDEFMKVVFQNLENDEIGVAPNEEHSVYYVVQVKNRFPASSQGEEQLKRAFLRENLFFFSPYAQLAGQEQGLLAYQWSQQLEAKYNVQWFEAP